MSSIYVQCAVVFGVIFACLVAIGYCIMPRYRAAPSRPLSEADLIAHARAHVTSARSHALLDEVERGRARREQ